MIGNARDAPLGPAGVIVICVSTGFLGLGILWPQAAEALLRVYLATLAVLFVVGRAYGVLPSRTTQDSFSPFAGAAARGRPSTPQVLRKLAGELAQADHPRNAERAAIPWPVRRTLIDEATARLTERHNLDPRDPRHQDGIRALVSEATWQLIDPGGRRFVPVSRLDLILDDLERL